MEDEKLQGLFIINKKPRSKDIEQNQNSDIHQGL